MAIVIPNPTAVARRLPFLRRAAQRDPAELMLKERHLGPFRESFRLLALNLHSVLKHRTGRAVAVVSAYSGDGRTLVAANLALALAEEERVLLVEGTRSEDAAHDWLGQLLVSPARASENGLPAGLKRPALQSNHPRLWLVPHARHSEADEGLNTLIAGANQAGLYTIVDSPPALASSEAFRIAREAGNALYVVRRKAQDMEVHRQIREQLARLQTEIIGLVINEF